MAELKPLKSATETKTNLKEVNDDKLNIIIKKKVSPNKFYINTRLKIKLSILYK